MVHALMRPSPLSRRLGGFHKGSGPQPSSATLLARVVYTCRVEMELGLCLKADVILLLFVRYF
jgi:hypothetical protein